MKRMSWVPLILPAAVSAAAVAQTPLGTGFTYQGRLAHSGTPANGLYDMRFRLYNAASGGAQVGSTFCADNVGVSGGLFAQRLDFGGQFNGDERFLEVEVRADTGLNCSNASGFVVLTPRQAITAAPYALQTRGIFVNDAGLVGIGTTAPLAHLHIDGASSSLWPGIYVNHPGGSTGVVSVRGSTFGPSIAVNANNGHRREIFASDTGFAFCTSSSISTLSTANGLFIDESGNVGIGTVTPASKLHIAGSVFADAELYAIQPGDPTTSVFLGWAQDAGGAAMARLRIAGNGPGASNGIDIQRPGNVSLMRITGGGSVGIGTTTPLDTLHVAGNVLSDGDVRATIGSAEVFMGWGADPAGGSVARIRVGGSGANAYNGLDVQGPGNVSLLRIHGNGEVSGHTLHFSSNSNTAPTAFFHNAGSSGDAAIFSGDVYVGGALNKLAGSFRIDHPLDPANKYLSHSFVESPDMMNIYNGNVVTDERGYATITMPEWFEALNRDFRYQLTVIDGADGDDFVLAKVVREIADRAFTIRTSRGAVKVSWQVTGIRQDPWAEAHRIPVEHDKPEHERGRYRCPELYGLPSEMGIGHAAPGEANGNSDSQR